MRLFLSILILSASLALNAQEIALDTLLGKTHEVFNTEFLSQETDTAEISEYPEFHCSYYSYKQAGVSFLIEHNILNTIFIYIQDKEGFTPFNNKYVSPVDINEFSNKKKIRKLWGEPPYKNKENSSYIWDKYDKGEYLIHFEYDSKEKVRMITLMIKEED